MVIFLISNVGKRGFNPETQHEGAVAFLHAKKRLGMRSERHFEEFLLEVECL